MSRSALALLLATATAALTGCGGSDDAGPASLPLSGETVAPATTTIELSEGRLGGATTVRVGARPRHLAPSGPMDVTPNRRDVPRDGVSAADTCADAALAPSAANLPAIADVTLCLLNGRRADAGLPPLTANPALTTAATAYAQDLVAGSYFSHTGRDGSTIRTRLEAAGYLRPNAGWAIGENLAWGTGALATPGSIVQAWMNSPGHRDNLLNPDYREIGVGIAPGNPVAANGAGATYATAFGVIEDAAGEPASRPVARPARKSSGRKRAGKRRPKAHIAGRASDGKRGGKGKRRGPTARIAI